MKISRYPLFLSLLTFVTVASWAQAQELDGSDLRREARERQEIVNQLSTEDQLKLRAAQRKAAEDPEVKAALQKRNAAVLEFRAALRASMIKADPTVVPILDKIAAQTAPTPTPTPRMSIKRTP